MRQGEASEDGIFVSFNAANEALKLSDVTVSCLSEPIVKTFSLAMTKHGHELPDQFIHHVGYRTRLTHESQLLFLGVFKIGRGADKEPERIFGAQVLPR